MQTGVSMPGETPPKTSEDCLYLNIWAPAAAKNLPVIVWIYGGGFFNGSASMPLYWGDKLATRGAIVVTFGYRVGPFGFLAHPELTAESPHHSSGNYGVPGSDRRAQMGPTQYRGLRRRSRARRHRRPIRRRGVRQHPDGIAAWRKDCSSAPSPRAAACSSRCSWRPTICWRTPNATVKPMRNRWAQNRLRICAHCRQRRFSKARPAKSRIRSWSRMSCRARLMMCLQRANRTTCRSSSAPTPTKRAR